MFSSLSWLLLLTGSGFFSPEESLYQTAPADWRAEVIPFPLAFAADLGLEGVEELRFAPGMFDAGAADYFSYSFVWWLTGDPEITPAKLEENLLVYFKGLYEAVSKKEEKNTEGFKVSVRATREKAWVAGASQNFRGGIDWLDPFVTEKNLHLDMMVAQWHCSKQKRTAVFFLISPQPGDHAVWKTLKAMRAGTCAP